VLEEFLEDEPEQLVARVLTRNRDGTLTISGVVSIWIS